MNAGRREGVTCQWPRHVSGLCGFVNKPFIHEKTGIDYELTSMYWRVVAHA